MVMPTMDVLTDLAFIVTSKFYSRTVFYNCCFFYVISNVAFLYRLYEKGHWYRCFYRSFYDWRHLLFLGANALGQPTMIGKAVVLPPWASTGVLGSVSYILLWIAMIILQISAPLLFVVYMLSHFAFILLWLFVGFFLFQSKVVAIKEVDNFWLLVWTGELVHVEVSEGVSQAVDMNILNQSIFFEFLLETLPQIVIQVYNQLMVEKRMTEIGYFSSAMSFSIMFNGAYRFGYYKFWWGLTWQQIPPSSNLMPDPNSYRPDIGDPTELALQIANPPLNQPEDLLWRFLLTHQLDLRVLNVMIIRHVRSPRDLLIASDRTLEALRSNIRGEGNLELFDALVDQLDRTTRRGYLDCLADWIFCRFSLRTPAAVPTTKEASAPLPLQTLSEKEEEGLEMEAIRLQGVDAQPSPSAPPLSPAPAEANVVTDPLSSPLPPVATAAVVADSTQSSPTGSVFEETAVADPRVSMDPEFHLSSSESDYESAGDSGWGGDSASYNTCNTASTL